MWRPLNRIVISLFSCYAPPTCAFNKYGELKPGHHSRQRAVSVWHRSGDHTLYYKYNAVAMFHLTCGKERSGYQNFDTWTETTNPHSRRTFTMACCS